MCVFLAWKRRCADVRAGTQAPPLRFRLGGLRVGGWCRLGRLRVERLVSFGWIARGCFASFLHYSARKPLRILFFYAFYFCSVYFFNG